MLIASTAFVVTALAYLVSPYVAQRAADRAADGPGQGSLALAEWLDRRSPTALAVEFAVMLVSGLLAMLTDRPPDGNPSRGGPTTD